MRDGAPLVRVYGPAAGEGDRGAIVAFNVLDRDGRPVPYGLVEDRAERRRRPPARRLLLQPRRGGSRVSLRRRRGCRAASTRSATASPFPRLQRCLGPGTRCRRRARIARHRQQSRGHPARARRCRIICYVMKHFLCAALVFAAFAPATASAQADARRGAGAPRRHAGMARRTSEGSGSRPAPRRQQGDVRRGTHRRRPSTWTTARRWRRPRRRATARR